MSESGRSYASSLCIHGVTVLLTVAIAVTMGYSLHMGGTMASAYASLVGAAMEMRFEAAVAHLWFEEVLSGDRAEDIQSVWNHLDRSAWYAAAMLNGGESERGTLTPLEVPHLREEVEAVVAGLAEFRRVAEKRYAMHTESGAGSEIDQHFDVVFRDLMAQAHSLEMALLRLIEHQRRRFVSAQWGLNAICLVLGILILTMVHREALRHRRHVRELQERDALREQDRCEIESLARFPRENPNPVLRVAGDGHVMYANAAARAIIDRETDAPVGEIPSRWRSTLEAALAPGGAIAHLEELAGTRVLNLAFVPVITAGYANIYGSNVTGFKRTQDRLRETQGVLERRVAERTAELNQRVKESETLNRSMAALLREHEGTNRELEKAKNELEMSNRELQAFAYSVSHDLRAPLRGVDGFCKALIEDHAAMLDDKGRDYLHCLRQASQQMGALIDSLLQLSRATCHPMEKEPLDLAAIAESVAADLQTAFPAHDVAFSVSGDLSAHGDPHLLRILLVNLLGNAWKFTRGADSPRVQVGRLEEAGQRVHYVRDNGAGFDTAYADRLFAPFQRLHRADEFEGTGIGLATAERIVHRHGGRIWGESVPGQGATFFFTIRTGV